MLHQMHLTRGTRHILDAECSIDGALHTGPSDSSFLPLRGAARSLLLYCQSGRGLFLALLMFHLRALARSFAPSCWRVRR